MSESVWKQRVIKGTIRRRVKYIERVQQQTDRFDSYVKRVGPLNSGQSCKSYLSNHNCFSYNPFAPEEAGNDIGYCENDTLKEDECFESGLMLVCLREVVVCVLVVAGQYGKSAIEDWDGIDSWISASPERKTDC